MADSTNSGRFKPGQSGNPSGKPKTDKALVAQWKKMGARAMEIIAELSETGDKKTRLEAAKYLADRAYGKPGQSVELSGKDGGPLVAVIRDG